MKGLTKKQSEMLQTITDFQKKHKYTPSIDELAKLTGRTKTPTHSLLQRLEARGYIRRTPGLRRSIEIL